MIEFWWESLGTYAECLKTISEYNVNVDIREIIGGHWWLMVLGQDYVHWKFFFLLH